MPQNEKLKGQQSYYNLFLVIIMHAHGKTHMCHPPNRGSSRFLEIYTV